MKFRAPFCDEQTARKAKRAGVTQHLSNQGPGKKNNDERTNPCSSCSKTQMLMNPNSDGRCCCCCCCTKSICPLQSKRMASRSDSSSFTLRIFLEKRFPDPCVCCFLTSQTVPILFVSLPRWSSTHHKCVCRPV